MICTRDKKHALEKFNLLGCQRFCKDSTLFMLANGGYRCQGDLCICSCSIGIEDGEMCETQAHNAYDIYRVHGAGRSSDSVLSFNL